MSKKTSTVVVSSAGAVLGADALAGPGLFRHYRRLQLVLGLVCVACGPVLVALVARYGFPRPNDPTGLYGTTLTVNLVFGLVCAQLAMIAGAVVAIRSAEWRCGGCDVPLESSELYLPVALHDELERGLSGSTGPLSLLERVERAAQEAGAQPLAESTVLELETCPSCERNGRVCLGRARWSAAEERQVVADRGLPMAASGWLLYRLQALARSGRPAPEAATP